MSLVIEMYQIQFVTKFIQGEYEEQIYSNNDVLSQFVNDYNADYLINDYLLSPINEVLNGTVSERTIVSESCVFAKMTSNVTKLFRQRYYKPTDPPNFSLPTSDLKEIAEAWLNYITESPF